MARTAADKVAPGGGSSGVGVANDAPAGASQANGAHNGKGTRKEKGRAAGGADAAPGVGGAAAGKRGFMELGAVALLVVIISCVLGLGTYTILGVGDDCGAEGAACQKPGSTIWLPAAADGSEPFFAAMFCNAKRATVNWDAGKLGRACVSLDSRLQVGKIHFGPGVHRWWALGGTSFLREAFAIAAFAIPLARTILDFVFLKLGQRVLARVMRGVVPAPDDVTLIKWREACWKALMYFGLAAFGAYVVAGEPWLTDTERLWLDWPEQTHSYALRLWYSLEFGLYGYGLVDLLVWEATRNDYFAMIIHHVSTLSLLFGSFYFGFLRIGALIMIMNDFVDLFFECAKIANYAKARSASTGFYVAFCATWFVLRQVYCPLLLLWSCWSQAWSLVTGYGTTTLNIGVWMGFNLLLAVLQIQHTYWFVFIIKKVKVTFSVEVIGRRDTDLTEDD